LSDSAKRGMENISINMELKKKQIEDIKDQKESSNVSQLISLCIIKY